MLVQLTLIGGLYGILTLTPLDLPEECLEKETPVQCVVVHPDLQQYRLAEDADPMSAIAGRKRERTEFQVFVLSVTDASGRLTRYAVPEDELDRVPDLKAAIDYVWSRSKPENP